MSLLHGFVLKNRVSSLIRCTFRRRNSTMRYQKNDPIPSLSAEPLSRLLSWTQRIKTKAKAICSKASGLGSGSGSSGGYVQIGQEVSEEKLKVVPKGHMAVYVGQKEYGDCKRVLVPVIYFNHPLFSELLREVEDEYGFNYPGGNITIPCQISEFERVQTRIKQGRVTSKLLSA